MNEMQIKQDLKKMIKLMLGLKSLHNKNNNELHRRVGFAGLCMYLNDNTRMCAYKWIDRVAIDAGNRGDWYMSTDQYPVPASRTELDFILAKRKYCESTFSEKWIEGEYAELRWEFVDLLIKEARKELNQLNESNK